MFAPLAGPRVFGLPPGADFSRALVAGIEARLAGHPPETLARVEIWVNTQRACRALCDALSEGPARLLPRIRALSELADDPRAPLDLALPVPALRRKLELARLVGRLIAAEPGFAAETAAFDLADSLAELMDEMQGEGVELDALARLDTGEHAAHWQRSLRFLDILRGYVAAGGMTDGQGRMRRAAEAFAQTWTEAPPQHPIIVAGSTGSRGATRAFMAAVARLPQGALVLPGYDADLAPAVWERLGAHDPGAADHPQFGFRRLAEALGFDPATVPAWHETPPPSRARNALVSLAMRPAPVTDQWRLEGGRLAPTLETAMAGLVWLEAEGARTEARAIALALRDAAAAGERAALVTPDRTLARRVTAELSRWGLIPDDSAGRPLALTPPGVLLARLAGLPGQPLTPEALLILLKHPLVNSGPDARGAHLALAARLELTQLRGGPPQVHWPQLAAWAEAEGGEAPAWIAWAEACLAPLQLGEAAPLSETIARHHRAAEALAAGPSGAEEHALWEKAAGTQALALMRELAAEAEALGRVRPLEYRALLRSLMAARDVPEEAVVTHPGIAIWGTLEARVQSADLMILGGLNEGIWPRLPGADPWLSRAMRVRLDLPSPERQIGLSAHDFEQACGAARVILSRAARDAEAPTVPARWLLRLENLLRGLGSDGMRALIAARERGEALLARAAALDRPAREMPPAPRPAPRPPVAARPAELSVTQIEALVRDPYEIYARKVLRLHPLAPPGRIADALARGTALHQVMEAYLARIERDPAAEPQAVFAAAADAVLAETAPWPAVRAIWAARLDKAAPWFLQGEIQRRDRAAPLARERRGRRPLDGLAMPFAVTARADRIDQAAEGYAIYDYKSGGVPSAPEAKVFHLQLWLEAAIAGAGGFEGLPLAPALHLELIGIGARKTLVLDADPDEIAAIWERLHRLIAHYQAPQTGFVARLRLKTTEWSGDYDHLSRFGEWADGDRPDFGGAP